MSIINTLLELTIAVTIVLLIAYGFFMYLKWSLDMYGEGKKSIWLPPYYVAETYKYINFWMTYYLARQTSRL
jgi:hypothetical protein